MSASAVPLRPLVSWPEEVETGRKYLVTVDVELAGPEPGTWPYDTEEYAVGCVLEAESGLAVEAVGDTTLVLHRFGGTYGPARFVTYAAGGPEGETALRLTLVTAGGVPFRSERLEVRVGAGEAAPVLDVVEVPLPGPAGEPAVSPRAEGLDSGRTGPTVLIAPGSEELYRLVRSRVEGLEGEPRRYTYGSSVEVGRLSDTGWRVVLLRGEMLGGGNVADTASAIREFRVSLAVSVVPGRPGGMLPSDVLVADKVETVPRYSGPSAWLRSVTRAVLYGRVRFGELRTSRAVERVRPGGPYAVLYADQHPSFMTMYGLRVEHLGICAVDDIAARLAVDAVVSLLAALPSVPPPAPDLLIGREEELARLVELLNPETAGRATAVTGIPGIGKTALAVAAAEQAEARGWYPGGIYFLPGEPDSYERARHALTVTQSGIGPALFLFDGVDPDDGPTPWNSTQEYGFHTLVTSRHRSPAGPDPVRLNPLSPRAAAELLDPQATDPEAATALAELCGRVPQALELVARSSAPLPEVRAAVERAGGVFHHFGELRRTYDAEFAHLAPDEERALRLLAVVPGEDAHPELLLGMGTTGLEASLARLEAAGLVERNQAGGRWRMPALVRSYVRQSPGRHIADEEVTSARQLLLGYCVQRTRGAVRALGLSDAEDSVEPRDGWSSALDWLDGEHPTLLALVLEDSQGPYADQAAELALHLGAHLNWRRRFEDSRRCCLAGLQSDWSRHRAAPLWNLHGAALSGLGLLDEAADSHVRALALYEDLADLRGCAKAYDALGQVRAEQSDWDNAHAAFQQAIRELRRVGDRRGEAEALMHEGVALLHRGDDQQALAALYAAVNEFRSLGDQPGAARADLYRAEALSRSGMAEAAVGTAERVMRDFTALRDQHALARAWEVVARARENLGLASEAEAAWNISEQAFAAAGDTVRARSTRSYAEDRRRRAAEADLRVQLDVERGAWSTRAHWTLRVVRDSLPTALAQGTERAPVPRMQLGGSMGEQLAAFVRSCDLPERPVPLEVTLPLEYFDSAPHTWTAGSAAGRLGEQRPVTIRGLGRGALEENRLRHWQSLRDAGRLDAVHTPLGSGSWRFSSVPAGQIPCLCGPVSQGAGRRLMSRLIRAGHGAVLWSTLPHPGNCGPECMDRFALARALVLRCRGLAELPVQLWRDRRDAPDNQQLSLLYDDPEAPLPGSLDLLAPPSFEGP
ncbi:AAA family ATPase [Streptomyces sp. NPDC002671]